MCKSRQQQGQRHLFSSVRRDPGMVWYPPGQRGSWLWAAPAVSAVAWAPRGLSLAGRQALLPWGAGGTWHPLPGWPPSSCFCFWPCGDLSSCWHGCFWASTAHLPCRKPCLHGEGQALLSREWVELTDWRTWLKNLSSSSLHHGLEGTALGEPLLAGSCEGDNKEQPARQGRGLFIKKPNSFNLKRLRKAESSGNICGLHPVIVSGMKCNMVLSLCSHYPWYDIGQVCNSQNSFRVTFTESCN